MKFRSIKNRNIIVNEVQYVYSIIEYNEDIQIRVYVSKIPFVHLHLSYHSSFGINVFRPKTVEILIKYTNQYYSNTSSTIELYIPQEEKLFYIYVNYFFSDKDNDAKEKYIKFVKQYPSMQ